MILCPMVQRKVLVTIMVMKMNTIIGMGPVVAPTTLLENRGPTPLAGPRWNNGHSSPPGKKSGAVAGGTSFVQDLRAASLTPLSPEDQARTIQQLLFAAPPSDDATGTEGPSGSRRSRDEPVAFLHVECPNFSAVARKESKAAWRHLLLPLSKEGSPPLRPLDILPMSAIYPDGCIHALPPIPRSTRTFSGWWRWI